MNTLFTLKNLETEEERRKIKGQNPKTRDNYINI